MTQTHSQSTDSALLADYRSTIYKIILRQDATHAIYYATQDDTGRGKAAVGINSLIKMMICHRYYYHHHYTLFL